MKTLRKYRIAKGDLKGSPIAGSIERELICFLLRSKLNDFLVIGGRYSLEGFLYDDGTIKDGSFHVTPKVQSVHHAFEQENGMNFIVTTDMGQTYLVSRRGFSKYMP